MEGLYIDEKVSFSDLNKPSLLAKEMFGKKLRLDFALILSFTEPSEVDTIGV